MMRRSIVAVAVALIVASGCAGSDSSDDTASDTEPAATTAPQPTASTVPVPVAETIAGSIIFDGDVGSGVILVVAVVVGDNGPPAYGVELDAAGPYTLSGVADGEYVVQAFLDTADDRGPPEADEPQGFYDANGDGTADVVVVSGGVGVIGIDITLV